MPQLVNLTRRTEIGANSYLLELGGRRIVLDSGLHPEHDGEEALPLLNEVAEDSVDAIFLSHAHHDHLGSLPVTMRRQPGAPVFMTDATRRLSDVMLHNSVNVMEKKAEAGAGPPHFGHREVDRGARRWQCVPLRQRWDLTGERLAANEEAEVSFEFFDAGHILGSVGVLLRGEGRSIFYTGDVNFHDQTISRAASFPEEGIDTLIIETTRGDTPTPEGFTRAAEEKRFATALAQALEGDGSVVVPVFALGKTQEVLAMIHGFRRSRALRTTPLYIGGLSAKLTVIHDELAQSVPRQLPGLQLLDEVAPFVLAGREAGSAPIRPGRIYAISSGMMTENTLSNIFARRVLSDPRQSLFFVGYADPKSPAGHIRAAQPGDLVTLDSAWPPQELRCPVEVFNFSAHATRESLRDYIRRLAPKKVVLVHGDAPAVRWFREQVAADLPGSEVIVPEPGVPVDL